MALVTPLLLALACETAEIKETPATLESQSLLTLQHFYEDDEAD